MKKIKFFMIPNVERMMEMVCASQGQIFMQKGGNMVDVKNDPKGHQAFAHEITAKNPVGLYVSDIRDYFNFIHFMAGANL